MFVFDDDDGPAAAPAEAEGEEARAPRVPRKPRRRRNKKASAAAALQEAEGESAEEGEEEQDAKKGRKSAKAAASGVDRQGAGQRPPRRYGRGGAHRRRLRARVLRGDDPSGQDPGQHLQRRHQQYRHQLASRLRQLREREERVPADRRSAPRILPPAPRTHQGPQISAHPESAQARAGSPRAGREGAQRLQRRVPDHMAVARRAFPRADAGAGADRHFPQGGGRRGAQPFARAHPGP